MPSQLTARRLTMSEDEISTTGSGTQIAGRSNHGRALRSMCRPSPTPELRSNDGITAVWGGLAELRSKRPLDATLVICEFANMIPPLKFESVGSHSSGRDGPSPIDVNLVRPRRPVPSYGWLFDPRIGLGDLYLGLTISCCV